MDTIELSKKALHAEADVLHKLADQIGETFIQGADMLANCTGHVITSGVGTTGMVARRFAHLLCNVGCPALFLHSGDSLHGSSGAVKSDDVLFLLSKTGETKETCDMARVVSERGSPIIALTAQLRIDPYPPEHARPAHGPAAGDRSIPGLDVGGQLPGDGGLL